MWSNYFVVNTVKESWQSIPYGYPIQNCQYYLIDTNNLPCKINQPGEILIGGLPVAEGYTNARLSKRQFVKNFLKPSEGTLYRTGDVGVLTASGWINLLGRIDNQVKIRGHRIELGEIESALRKLGFKSVVALAVGEGFDKKIVAFTEATKQSSDNVLQALADVLPQYMLPSQIISLKQIPLTDNGKIDRNQLNNRLADEWNAQKSTVDIENSTQNTINSTRIQAVTNIVRALLGVSDAIDAQKNIGELGFTSLKYTVLSLKIEQAFNKVISPAEFCELNR